jgi:hypothetical protein
MRPTSDKRDLARLDRLADLLDSSFRVPGTNIRFGLDSILGFLPLVGDSISALPALYLIYRAKRLGVPDAVIGQMLGNVVIDLLVGSVPVLGDLFDVAFKANRRNIALIRAHIGRDKTPN